MYNTLGVYKIWHKKGCFLIQGYSKRDIFARTKVKVIKIKWLFDY
jgi:hypothetical protein